MIDYDDLETARGLVLKRAGRVFPGRRSLDAYTPTVEAGLIVVEFDVPSTMTFAREVMGENSDRILHARKKYALDLFVACYASGLTVGAQAERDR
jgi:hypothetical protein